MSELIILFVGSNPSNSSTCDVAFHGSTRSSKRLTSWIQAIPGGKFYINVLDKKTNKNRPLKKSEISLNLEDLRQKVRAIRPHKIVGLGKTAQIALKAIGVEFFCMPHPSGRNRQLNDPKFIEQKIKELVEYVSTSSSSS